MDNHDQAEQPERTEQRLAEIDSLCDRFESDWLDGQEPSIEEYLARGPGDARQLLFKELLESELELLRKSGQTPQASPYHERFPDLSPVVAAAFGQLDETIQVSTGETSLGPDRSSSPEDSKHPEPPTKLGRYIIERPLGKGGMGTVFLAHDTTLERLVALKIPHFEGKNVDVLVERFHREARTMAAIRHPNLCTVFDVADIDGFHCMTMEYLEGESLYEHLKHHGPLESGDVARLISKLAQGLQLAHDAGVVHRDLKPSNVLLRKDGEPVLTDFGLARRLAVESLADSDSKYSSTDDPLTLTGVLIGTPAYMSPEQVDGEADLVGPPSDIYSLGVLMYVLLTGRLPFEGSVARVMASVLLGNPDPPSTHCPDVDPVLERICLKAMAKEPKDRFESASEFGQALENYLAPAISKVPPKTYATVAVVIGLLTWLAAFIFRTPEGTVIVEISDPQVESVLTSVGLTVRNQENGRSFSLGVGPHRLPIGNYSVRPGSSSELRVDSEEFSLEANDDFRLHIGLPPPVLDPIGKARIAFLDSAQLFDVTDALDSELADVDGDGDSDLIVTSLVKDAGGVWINDGSGLFSRIECSAPLNGSHIAAGDIDGDGDVDLWQVRALESDLILLNDGAGEFSLGTEIPDVSHSLNASLADLDGDGDLDCFLSNGVVQDGTWQPRPNTVLLNDGRGRFVDSGQELGDAFTSQSVVLDADSDGALDICSGNLTGDGSVLWLNDGNGKFEARQFLVGGVRSLAAGDFDSDGDMDLVLGSADSSNLVLLNDGHGTFTESGVEFGHFQSELLIPGDFDQDGDLDVLTANDATLNPAGSSKPAPMSVWWNNGNGVFAASWQFDRRQSCDISAGDVDGDGDLDVFDAAPRDGVSRLLLNQSVRSPVKFRPAGNMPDGDQNIFQLDDDGSLQETPEGEILPAK